MKLRKTAAALLAAVLAASAPLAGAANNALSVTASAEETDVETQTEGDWEYMVNEDGETVRITKYNGTEAELVIPATLGGKSVTAISYQAFERCASLTSVTIPKGVTTIGYSAFGYCESLTSVTIPDGVTVIGEYAFFGCDSLTSVTIPDSVTEMDSAFASCHSLENITVGENNANYSSIDGILFNSDKSNLVCFPAGKKDKSYTIPDNVTTLNKNAFRGCASLTSVSIPDKVPTIDVCSFAECTSLTSITIPDSVTFINSSAFYGCTSLTDITIPESVTLFGNFTFRECTSLTSVTISSGMTSIGLGSFIDCTSLKSVRIPNSVTKIEWGVFADCSSLETIYYSGTQEEWEAVEIAEVNDVLENVEVIYNAPAESEPTSEPDEDPVTPGGSDKPKQETLETTLKNVDSENGIEGEALDKLLFGESGWTWNEVEKVVFTSDKPFSVQFSVDNDGWKTLGEETARASVDGKWSTEWTLNASEMAKDKKYAKVIAKEGTADIKTTVYIKKGAAKPSADDQKPTGITLAMAPAVLAAGAAIVLLKKRK